MCNGEVAEVAATGMRAGRSDNSRAKKAWGPCGRAKQGSEDSPLRASDLIEPVRDTTYEWWIWMR